MIGLESVTVENAWCSFSTEMSRSGDPLRRKLVSRSEESTAPFSLRVLKDAERVASVVVNPLRVNGNELFWQLVSIIGSLMPRLGFPLERGIPRSMLADRGVVGEGLDMGTEWIIPPGGLTSVGESSPFSTFPSSVQMAPLLIPVREWEES